MDSAPVQIELKTVAKTYGDHNVHALESVSLSIVRGEFIALTGASGCGKSTLLNIIGGIDRPTSGSIFFGGQDLAKLNDNDLTAVRATKLGFIFQFFNLLSTMTVEENIALPLELVGKSSASAVRKHVAEILERVKLSHRAKFYPSQLSGGEMQRTAIARALIHSPELILADEPTGNLDTENGTIILEMLQQINADDKLTIIMATHSLEAAAYARRNISLKDGLMISQIGA
ncbi:MAG: ABC transporter ATP-binding protein [Candidatus Obscuribacterales bacterium]|nr:ABC transporter ATP-binding protein [Candidatus Obscuribacterales bacterium]